MSQDDSVFELSRRKALTGLGTIGLASAGAGMGTTALFSDTERFEDNTIQAGTTNLIVRAKVVEEDFGSTSGGSISIESNEADGSPALGITVSDTKPGDSFVVCWDVEVEDNPMYVAAFAENLSDSENTPNPEPEPSPGADDNDDGIPGGGDLDNKIDVTLGYDSSANDNSWDGSISGTEFNGSLTKFLEELETGYLYRGQNGDSGSPPGGHGGSSASPTRVGDTDADVGNVTHYTKFEIPTGVGNQIQGDSVSFDLVWHAEQVRHNSVSSASDVKNSGT